MTDAPRVNGLLAWVLGTFHTSIFGLALLLLLYPRGRFGDTLAGLSTLSGLAIFIALWATTIFTTRRALAGLNWLDDEPAEMAVFFRRALRWGGVNGMLFLAALGAILLASALAAARGPTPSPALIAFAVIAVIGLLVAYVVGALVGVTLGALDIAALRVARAFIRSQGLALVLLLGCTPMALPERVPPTHSLDVGNGTSLTVTLVVNGAALRVVPPGASAVIPVSELPLLPYVVEARSPRGRVLTSMTVHAGDVRETTTPDGVRWYQSPAVRVDLSCGRLDIWSGFPMLGPLPGPGRPGDCDP
jgi:hypothetical protein